MSWTSASSPATVSWATSAVSAGAWASDATPGTLAWSASAASSGTWSGTTPAQWLNLAHLWPVDLTGGGVNFQMHLDSGQPFYLAALGFGAVGSALTL